MSKVTAKLLLVFGVIFLAVGIALSVRSNLIGSVRQGLNGATENAVIFDLIGVVCLFAGWNLRR